MTVLPFPGRIDLSNGIELLGCQSTPTLEASRPWVAGPRPSGGELRLWIAGRGGAADRRDFSSGERGAGGRARTRHDSDVCRLDEALPLEELVEPDLRCVSAKGQAVPTFGPAEIVENCAQRRIPALGVKL